MGDDCNVVPRRNEESLSNSSPKITGAQRVKDLEEYQESRDTEIPVDVSDSLLLARQSGEPGEMPKIPDIGRDAVPPEDHELTVMEPLLYVSSGQSSIPGFPYSETKLRPDAPPFTPESLTRSGPIARGIDGISDAIRGKPSYGPRGKIDDSCFVNVDLRIPTVDQETTITKGATPVAKVKRSVAAPRMPQPLPAIRDPIRDPGLKPFSLTSTPRVKRSPPKVEPSVDSLHPETVNEAVAASAESGATEPEIRETIPESLGEPRVVRGHWRIFRTTFVIGNRIQIAVFIASIVLCVIIVIYVFV